MLKKRSFKSSLCSMFKSRTSCPSRKERNLRLEFLEERELLSATRTWTGGGTPDLSKGYLWNDAANWDAAPAAGDDLVFPTTGIAPPQRAMFNDISGNPAFNSITFAGGGYTLDGNPLTVGAGGISTTYVLEDAVTVNTNVALSANATVNIGDATASLTFTGNVLGNNTAGQVFQKTGAGELTLSGANNAMSLAQVNIESGTVTLQSGAAWTAGNATIPFDVVSGTTANGPATLNLYGNLSCGDFNLADTTSSFGSATVNMYDGANVSATGKLFVAKGPDASATFTQYGGNLTVSNFTLGMGTNSSGSYTLLAGNATNTASINAIGYGSGGTGEMTLSGGSFKGVSTYMGAVTGATGTLNISGTTNVSMATWIIADFATGANGTVNIDDNPTISGLSSGVGMGWGAGCSTFSMSGGNLASSGTLYLSHLAGSNSTLSLSGGNMSFGAQGLIAQAANATLNLSDGNISIGGYAVIGQAGGIGTVVQTGGNLNVTGYVALAGSATGNAVYTQTGGSLSVASPTGLIMGNVAAVGPTFWLGSDLGAGTAGTVTAATINSNGSTNNGNLVFDGGTVHFTSNTYDYNVAGGYPSSIQVANVNIWDGGGTIDDQGNALVISNNLLAGGTNIGGLTKVGNGTLCLTGSSTFGGGVNVAGGVLKITGDASLGVNTGTLRFSGNATLAALNNVSLPYTRDVVFDPGADVTIDTAAYTASISGGIAGSGNILNKLGSGRLDLLGFNTGLDSVDVANGTVVFGGDYSLPTSVVARAGTTVATQGSAAALFANLDPSSAGVLALAVDSSDSLDFSTIAGGLRLGALSGTTPTFFGALTPQGNTYRLGGGGGTLIVGTGLSGIGVSLEAGSGGTAYSTVIMTGSNDYDGGTTVDAGATLVFARDDTFPVSGSITVNAGGAVATNGTPSLLLSQLTTGSAGALALTSDIANLDVSATPNLRVGAAAGSTATVSGSLTMAGNTYRLGGGGGTLLVASPLVDNGNVARNVDVATTGPLSDTVIFAGSNKSYSGTTTITGSTLQLGDFGSDAMTLPGAVFNNGALAVQSLGPITLSGPISGCGAVTKGSSGTLTLLGNNPFTGGLKLVGGTLAVNSDAALGVGVLGTVTIDPGASDTPTLQFRASTTSYRPFLLGSSAGTTETSRNIDVLSGATVTLAGPVSGNINVGAVVINSDVAATGTLRVRDTFSVQGSSTSHIDIRHGAMVIDSGGVLSGNYVQVAAQTGDSASLTVQGTGVVSGVGDLNVGTGLADNVASVLVKDYGNVTVNGLFLGKGGSGGNITATFTQTGGTVRVNSQTNGANVALQLGTGSTNAGTYTLSGGLLQVAQGGGGAAPAAISQGLGTGTFVFDGGTLQTLSNSTNFMQGLTSAQVGDGGAIIDTANTVTIAQDLSPAGSGTGGLSKRNVGKLILSGTNTYGGNTTIASGTLNATTDAALGNTNTANIVFIGNATLQAGNGVVINPNRNVFLSAFAANATFDGQTTGYEVAGNISGPGMAIVAGSANSTVTFSGTNTYSGGTLVGSGTDVYLKANSASALGLGPVSTINFGSLRLAANATLANDFYLGSQSRQRPGALAITANDSNVTVTITGGIFVTSTNLDVAKVRGNNSSLIISGGINSLVNSTANLTADTGTGINIVINNKPVNLGAGNLTFAGSGGTVALNVGNNVVGGLKVDSSGTAILGVSNAFVGNVALTLGDVANRNGMLNLNGTNQTFASITAAGNASCQANDVITNSSATPSTLTVVNAATGNYAGVLSGDLALVMAGSAPLTLSGTNTLTNGITVNSGVLVFGNDTNLPTTPGSITVNSGATVSTKGSAAALLGNLTTSSAGVLGLSLNSSDALDFTNFPALRLGAAAGNMASYNGTLTPNLSGTYLLGGGGGLLFVGTLLTGSANVDVGLSGTPYSGVEFTANNDYTGNTTVNGGTLIFASDAPVTGLVDGSVTANANAAVGTNGDVDLLLNHKLNPASSGALALTTGNALPLDFTPFPNLSLGAVGDVTYSGDVTPAGSTFRLGGGSGNLTYAHPLSGTNSVVITADGGRVIYGNPSNAYTGNTTLTTGALWVPDDTYLGASTSKVVFNGGTLVYTGSTTVSHTLLVNPNAGGRLDAVTANTTVNLGLTNGNLTLNGGSGDAPFTFGGAGNITFASGSSIVLGSASPVTMVGTGNLTWTSPATLGSLTINAGTVQLLGNNATPATADLTLAAGGKLTSANATVQAFNNLYGAGTISGFAGGNLTVNSGNFNGNFALSPTTTVTKTGQGTLVLGVTGTPAYGNLVLANGNIQLAGNNAIAQAAIVSMGTGNNVALLDLNGFSQRVAGVNLTGNATTSNITNSSGIFDSTLTVNASTANTAFGGTISDGARKLALTVTGTNPFFFTVTGNNTYRGGTQIGATGNLTVNSDAALGASTGNITFAGSGTLQASANMTLNANRTVLINTGVTASFDAVGGKSLTLPSPVLGAGVLAKIDVGNLVLNTPGGVLNTGGTLVQQGNLVIAADNALPTNSALTIGKVNANQTAGLYVQGNQTVGTLLMTGAISGASQDNVNIAAGGTFTVFNATSTGNVVQVGDVTTNVTTKAVFTGNGAFAVTAPLSTLLIGGTGAAGDNATLDMSALSSFSAYVRSVQIGDNTGQAGTTTANLALAPTSTITANNIYVGYNSGRTGTQVLTLGNISNTLNVDNLMVGPGTGRANSAVTFLSPTAGNLTLRGTDGSGRVLLLAIGTAGNTTTDSAPSAIVNLSNHTVDALIGTLDMGHRGSGAYGALDGISGTLAFNSGSLDIAAATLGTRDAGVNSLGNSSGTLSLGGGNVTLGSLRLGSNNGSAPLANPVFGILSVSGSTVTMTGDILDADGAMPATSVVSITGGTLDMQGHAMGNAGMPIDILTSATPQTAGCLANVGQINGGTTGLVKQGPGTIVLTGTTAFTGGATINQGGLVFGSDAITTWVGGRGLVLNTDSGVGTLGNVSTLLPYIPAATSGALDLAGNVTTDLDLSAWPNLRLGAPAGLDATMSGNITMSGTTYRLGGTGGNLTVTSVLWDVGAVSHSVDIYDPGNGIVILSGNNTFTGGTTVRAGRLDIGSPTGLGLGTLTLSAGSVLSADANLTILNPISIVGSVSFGDPLRAGNLTLSGPITMGGNLTLTTVTPTTIAGNLSTLGDTTLSVQANTTVSGSVTLGGNWTVTCSNANQTNLLGSIGDGGAGYGVTYTSVATGNIVVSGNNTYSGMTNDTMSNQGATTGSLWLSAPGPGQYAVPGNFTLAQAAGSNYIKLLTDNPIAPTSNVVFNSTNYARLELWGHNLAVGSVVVLKGGVIESTENEAGAPTGATTLTLNGPNDSVVGTYLRDQGAPLAVVKNGAGNLSLSGANILYTGGTTINGGNVTLGTGTTGFKGNVTFGANSTSTFTLGPNNVSIGTLRVDPNFPGTPTILNGSASNQTLTVNQGSDLNFPGVIKDGGNGTLALVKNGLGNMTLSGNNAYSGGTTINGGMFAFTSNSALPSAGNIGIYLPSGSLRADGPYDFAGWIGSGRILGNSTGSMALVSDVLANQTVDLTGYPTLGVGAAENYTVTVNGTILWAGGNYTIGGGGGNLIFPNDGVFNNPTAFMTVNGGGGTVTLLGNNTFGGNVTVNAGSTLSFNAVSNDGTLSNVGNGAAITLAGGGLQYTGASTTLSRALLLSGNATLEVVNGSTAFTINGNVTNSVNNTFTKLGSGKLVLGGTGNNTGLRLSVTAGSVDLNKTSNAVVHAVVGIDNIGPGALVRLTGAGLDQIADSVAGTTVTLSGGTFDINGLNESIPALAGNGTVTNNGGVLATLTAGNVGGVTTFSGTLRDGNATSPLAFTKAGVGNLTLTGNNTFTGGTTVTRGNLAANAAVGYAIPGNYTGRASGGDAFLLLLADNQIPANATWTLGNISNGAFARVELLGHQQSVAMISSNTAGVIEDSENEVGIVGTGTLTINNSSDFSYPGFLRDRSGTNSNDTLVVVKSGAGNLTLTGANIKYTGGTTLNAGNITLANGTGSFASPIAFGPASISVFDIGNNSVTIPSLGYVNPLNPGSPAVQGNGNLTFNVANGTTTVPVLLRDRTGGSLGIGKAGNGTLILTGNNTFNGGLTLNAGLLQSGSSKALGSSVAGNWTINGGTLDLNGSSYPLGSLVGNGTAALITDNSLGNGTTTLTINQTGNTTYLGTISDGAGGKVLRLVKQGNANTTLTLNANNTFSGGTNLAAGNIAINSGLALGNGIITQSGTGRLLLGANITVSNPLVLGGGGVANAAVLSGPSTGTSVYNGNITINGSASAGSGHFGATGGWLYLNGYIGAAPSVVVSARVGNIQLSGGGNYALFQMNNAYVRLGGNDALSTAAALQFSPANDTSCSNVFDLNGFNQTLTGLGNSGGGSATGNYVTNTGTTLNTLTLNVPATPPANTASCVFPITGNIALVKTGAGVQTLGGNNNYSGNTTVLAGGLTLTGNNTLAGNFTQSSAGTSTLTGNNTLSGSLTLTAGSATLSGPNNVIGGSVTVTNASLILSGNNTLAGNFTLAGGTATLGGTTNLVGGNVTVTAGVLTLGGNNTFTGGLILVGGSASAASDANLGGLNVPITFNGGTLQVTGTTLTNLDSHPVNWSSFTGGFDIATTANNFVVGNSISGSGSFLKLGSGNLVVTGNNTYTGMTTVQGGNLLLNAASGYAVPGNLTVTSSSSNGLVMLLRDNQIAPTATWTMTRTGGTTSRVELLGHRQAVSLITADPSSSIQNSYSESGSFGNGVLMINNDVDMAFAGTLRDKTAISSTSTLSLVKNGAGNLTLSGVSINYTGGTTINTGNLTLGPSTTTFNGMVIFGPDSTSTLTLGDNNVTLTGLATDPVTPGSPVVQNGSGNARTLTANVASGTSLFAGTLRDGGTGLLNLVKLGNGTQIFGIAAYTGNTTLTAGTLQFGSGTSGSVSLLGNITDNGTLVFANPTDFSYAGTITGNGTLTKTGSGKLTLAGSNGYTGNTTVGQGALWVNGSLAGPGSVSVGSGALLGGGGSIAGDLLMTGGQLSPGNGAGSFSVAGNVTLSGNSAYQAELGGILSFDQLAANGGNVNIDGTQLALSLLYTPAPTTLFTLIDRPTGASAVSGTFAGLAEGSHMVVHGQPFTISYHGGVEGNDVVLSSDALQVQGVTFDDGQTDATGQRSMITRITVTFNGEVASTLGSVFDVVQTTGGTNPGAKAAVSVAWSNDPVTLASTATITFASSNVTYLMTGSITPQYGLNDGNYQLRYNAYNALDMSGEHMQARAADSFYRLFGDSDGDRDVDSVDLIKFRNVYLGNAGYDAYKAAFDYNGDGVVDSTDNAQMQRRLTRRLLP